MKSPATPIILLLGFFILLLNLCIHLVLLSLPYLKRFSVAAYRASKAYLKALLSTVETKARATGYYCYPLDDEGLIDTFLGVLMADLGWAIVRISGRLVQSRPSQTSKDQQGCFVSDAGLGRICE
jgi:hypothetical protein